MIFHDRNEAGRILGAALRRVLGTRPIVLGIPRGGVVVAAEVARALDAPLGVSMARKVPAPGHPEVAIGAVAEGGVRLRDVTTCEEFCVGDEEFDDRAERVEGLLAGTGGFYRSGRGLEPVAGRVVIVVDDGLATGSTMEAAVASLRARGARKVIVAAPVGALETVERIAMEADGLFVLQTPEDFRAVSQFYDVFEPVGDRIVRELLAESTRPGAKPLESEEAPGVA